jgi:hypothetical protein
MELACATVAVPSPKTENRTLNPRNSPPRPDLISPISYEFCAAVVTLSAGSNFGGQTQVNDLSLTAVRPASEVSLTGHTLSFFETPRMFITASAN